MTARDMLDCVGLMYTSYCLWCALPLNIASDMIRYSERMSGGAP